MPPVNELRKKRKDDPEHTKPRAEVETALAIAREMIEARTRAALTQDELASRMDTSRTVIAKLERGRTLPSTRTLQRFAVATGSRLTISFSPVKEDEGLKTRDAGVTIKSKKRVADHGEVFTPSWMVEAMLDLVKGETERIDSRFLEPACGSGNFLVRVLQRKLTAVELKFGKSDFKKRHYALLAVMCTYGIELLMDNIAECRANMLEILADYLSSRSQTNFTAQPSMCCRRTLCMAMR